MTRASLIGPLTLDDSLRAWLRSRGLPLPARPERGDVVNWKC